MSVKFVDEETGEILDVIQETTPAPGRRRTRETKNVPAKRERKRTPIWPVFTAALVILAFFVGGGVGTAMAQDEIAELRMQLDLPPELP